MTTLTTPDDVTDLCALLRQIKPEYISGVWFDPRKAADVIEALAAENERLTLWAASCFEAGFQERKRAERAEAECERLRDALKNIERFLRSMGVVASTAAVQRIEALTAENEGMQIAQRAAERDMRVNINAERSRAERAEAECAALRERLIERNAAIIQWCDVLDKAGEAFDFDPANPAHQNAGDYFCTVSKNAGLARVVCEADNAALAGKATK